MQTRYVCKVCGRTWYRDKPNINEQCPDDFTYALMFEPEEEREIKEGVD